MLSVQKIPKHSGPSFGESWAPLHLRPSSCRHISDPTEAVHIFKDIWEHIFHPHPPDPAAIAHTLDIERWVSNHEDLTIPDPIITLNTLPSTLNSPFSVADAHSLSAHLPEKAPGASGLSHSDLFNASLAFEYFPPFFKSATVCLIPKPGKGLTDPKNYRPISLLEILGKTFERLVNMRLRTHLETTYLPSNNLVSNSITLPKTF